MIAITLLAFGPAPWRGFIDNLGFARRVILEAGGLEAFKLQSAFAAARLLGAPLAAAYAAQAVVGALALAGLAWLWHGRHDIGLKLAGLALASLLVSPYAIDYDMVLVGVALAGMVGAFQGRPVPPYAASLMALAWIMPLMARPVAQIAHLPLGVLVTMALFAIVLVAARDAPAAPAAVPDQP